MDKSSKLYKKAVNLYENGYIDKAIRVCNKSIKLNKKNSSSLNLIGLLYYFKGELKSAERVWQINYKYNRDGVSKKYLQDSKGDYERFKLYVEGVKLYNQVKINEALEEFNKCKESDFNLINLNNYIGGCYIKKGNFNKALEYIDSVLALDKNNVEAKENKKVLYDYGVIKHKVQLNKVVKAIFALMLIFGITFGIKYIVYENKQGKTIGIKRNNYKSANLKKNIKGSISKPQISKENKDADKSQKNKENKSNNESEMINKQKAFSTDEVKKYIQGKQFGEIYEYMQKYDVKNLDTNEKLIYDRAINFMTKDGVKYFYNEALKGFKNSDINRAEVNLLKAHKFSKDSFLNQHIVYLLAVNYEKKEDMQKALDYYQEYNKNYLKANYSEMVLYKLAMLNRYKDKAVSKKYAKELKNSYPKSIYNNSNIKVILNK